MCKNNGFDIVVIALTCILRKSKSRNFQVFATCVHEVQKLVQALEQRMVNGTFIVQKLVHATHSIDFGLKHRFGRIRNAVSTLI